ncbi:MAG: NAD(P)/FAD-dependent oxidoreductase [Candidatus Micrarchaeaceae archaeon]
MYHTTKSVCIIGAGTIGLILAKTLAASGIEVDVYESKSNVSDGSEKASGIISKIGLDRIGVEYKKSIVNKLSGAILHSGSRKLRIKSNDTKAYVIDRGKYVEECASEAKREGAKIYTNTRFSPNDLIRLKDQYDAIVGADGAVSTVAKTFSFPPIGSYVLTYKAEYSGADVGETDVVDLFFDNTMMHNFFGWSVPYSHDIMELGLGIDSAYKKNSKAVFDRFVKKPEIAEMLKSSNMVSGHASMIPLETRQKTVIGNVLLVGDAAGQTKATTGGGIVFGSGCASIAADSITRYINQGIPLSRYERAWRRKYGFEMFLHKKIHNLYSSSSPARMDRIFNVVKAIGGEKFLGSYGDMDRPSIMLKRLIFRGLISD